MAYFKTRGRRPAVIDVIDPRRIEAAIDPPRWWRDQLDAVADQAPSLDLAAECEGTGPNPRETGPFVLEVRGADVTEIVNRYGITGLAVGRELDIRLAQSAVVLDIGLAHLGEPPTVVAYEGRQAAAEVALDARQRQIENVRLIGTAIDRVEIASPDGQAVLTYVRLQPTEHPKTGERKKKRR
jgi:hypothetical protein